MRSASSMLLVWAAVGGGLGACTSSSMVGGERAAYQDGPGASGEPRAAEREHESPGVAAAGSGVDAASPPSGAESRGTDIVPRFVPVLLFHQVCETACRDKDLYGVTKRDFAAMLAALGGAGYTSISPRDYVRAQRGDVAGLPERPILITFDDGRLDGYLGADPILRDARMRATMFVIVGKLGTNPAFFMSWPSVAEAHASGRWDIQLHADEGHVRIPVASTSDGVETSAFYANLRFDPTKYPNTPDHLESHRAWKTRVTSDIATGIASLRQHLTGYEPVAFAVPFGDYGQRHSNDPLIASDLRALFNANFDVWFTQDRPLDVPTDTHERGRFIIRNTTTVEDVMIWLATAH